MANRYVRSDRPPGASRPGPPGVASRFRSSCWAPEDGATVELRPVLLVDGDTVLATPAELAEGLRDRPGDRRGQEAPRSTASPTSGARTTAAATATVSATASSRSRPSPQGRADHMSKTKGGGSTRNGRDSNAQRLGVKVFGGSSVTAGTIIIRQRARSSTPARTSASAATTRCSPSSTAMCSSASARAARSSTSSRRPSTPEPPHRPRGPRPVAPAIASRRCVGRCLGEAVLRPAERADTAWRQAKRSVMPAT